MYKLPAQENGKLSSNLNHVMDGTDTAATAKFVKN